MEGVFFKVLSYILTVVPILSLLFTVRYQYITNQISHIRKEREDLNNYSVELVTVLYKYTTSVQRYILELNKMYDDMNKNIEINDRRSEFIYHLKDEYIRNEIELKTIQQKISLELPNKIFPGIKSKVLKSISFIENNTNNILNKKDSEENDSLFKRNEQTISELKQLFEKLIDDSTDELMFYSKMKIFRFKTWNKFKKEK